MSSQGKENDKTQTSYDRIARAYADEIYAELAGKPFDRQVLDQFAERVRGRGPVCDLGCGPAQIARYLRDREIEVAIVARGERLWVRVSAQVYNEMEDIERLAHAIDGAPAS